jgi:tripartite ATP-independent transporter DctM subunit
MLVSLYIVYILIYARLRPASAPTIAWDEGQGLMWSRVAKALFPPLFLMVGVLGSIFAGIASPTEAAAVGAVGATCLALVHGGFSVKMVDDVARSTMQLTSMVFIVLVGAAAFGLVFRGTGGDGLVRHALGALSAGLGPWAVLAIVMLFIFVIGFFLDFIEITFIHVPVLAPVMVDLGIDPLWLCILIAVNLQTSFLTPPFGFSLFYLRAVSPPGVTTGHIYRGIIPFVLLQLVGLLLVLFFPGLVTCLL